MTKTRFFSLNTAALALSLFFGLFLNASAQPQSQAGARFDITSYRIEAQLIPDQHLLRAGADITLIPYDATRSVIFELNGSLKVETVERNGKPLTGIVQDPVGMGALGPNVRVDLGEVVPANQPLTLRFRWSGALVSPEGGPLATKRLAYIGPEGSYLMYAARWFPFHDYAADRATADITILVPQNMQVAGSGDGPVTKQPPGKDGNARYRFVHSQPALIGNIAAGPYIIKDLHYGKYEIQFYALPGSENRIDRYAEMIGKALEFYTQQYGSPAFGTRFTVAQTDDETLDAYAAPGMMFLSTKLFDSAHVAPEERLQREVAYQWWGQTVGLRAFDDAWISQGLAEWSSFALRETTLTGGPLDAAQRDELERALTFEATASIARAPGALDDQSAAYQSIVFYKGAMVFRMLRETLGKEKFAQLLHTFLDQYRGKSASIDDFEKLTTNIAGRNMRYFFAQWVEGTGVPEFGADYQIIRTRGGKFRTRGTVKQNLESLNMPVEVQLHSEGDNQTTSVNMEGKSEDFDFESNGSPIEVIVDPNNKILRMSDELRVAVVARRGIELFREGQYAEAQQQFEAALKLDKSNSWVYYNLGLLYLEQRNWNQALDNLQAALDGNLKPNWIEAWAHIKRGNTYDARGDRARAVAEYNKAVSTGITYDNAQTVAKRFLATPFDPKSQQAQN
ncbi:MAG TPA: M1 family aminopeptidase [Pyrinomonadaceae bacterium]|jgi:tetratricopeptide (TPR) repeat protein|nr:M1 family aminopeptidase [Pyrinomonadaceae bacterium]